MKSKREKTKVLLVRIFCIVLSALMVSSMAYLAISFIFGA